MSLSARDGVLFAVDVEVPAARLPVVDAGTLGPKEL